MPSLKAVPLGDQLSVEVSQLLFTVPVHVMGEA